MEWHIAQRPSVRRAAAARRKASLRAKAEFPFRWLKRVLGDDKVRYRGLHQYHQRLAQLRGLTQV